MNALKVMLLAPHLSGGGGERVVSDLSCSLRADELVLVLFEKKFTYPYKGRVISLDLPVDRRSLLSRFVGLTRRLWRVRGVLRRERPDVVLSFMGEANIINALLSKRPIVSIHGHLSSLAHATHSVSTNGLTSFRIRFESVFNRIVMGTVLRRATVVAVASAIRTELIEHFRIPERQIVVIPNAVDTQKIQTLSREPADCPWRTDLPVVITTGRLTAAKGQWHLIRAFAEIRKRMPCQLAILGTGEMEDYLKRLVEELKLDDYVFFLGWQDNPFKFMSRATVFVLSSLSEAFPLVLLEAMACGLPVISADCPGDVRDILAPGTKPLGTITQPHFGKYGVLVSALGAKMPVGDTPLTPQETQLADAIVHLLESAQMRERYRLAGQERIQAFDHRVFLERYQHLVSSEATSNEIGVPHPR
jgi:glycosyltransferase involved in cell wall biosynthesis